ncbi:MAG: shikimate dehydrogenase [Bacteroidales bacterium 45-6]|nr:MAG: shikimate dehydrogenase [Bacteroidales bacterium 45-6]
MDIYGLVGFPLKHSFSRKFFTEKFARENIDAQYLNFEIPDIAQFPGIIAANPDLRGLNVTIPYKEKVIPYLDELDPQAQEIGAVNVIRVEKEGSETRLVGYNSDLLGFQNSIAPILRPEIHRKALILGTGGASKAVRCGLKNLGLETKFVSRRAAQGQFSYSDLNKEVLSEYNVIVNTTPLGTFPNVEEAPEIPYDLLGEENLLFDLVYNPEETKFLKLGKNKNATTKNGAKMLELQAIAAWEIWNK